MPQHAGDIGAVDVVSMAIRVSAERIVVELHDFVLRNGRAVILEDDRAADLGTAFDTVIVEIGDNDICLHETGKVELVVIGAHAGAVREMLERNVLGDGQRSIGINLDGESRLLAAILIDAGDGRRVGLLQGNGVVAHGGHQAGGERLHIASQCERVDNTAAGGGTIGAER